KEGVYVPGALPNNSIALKAGVAIYGGFAGTETDLSQRDWEAHPSVLSGDIDHNDLNKDSRGVITDTANITGTNSRIIVSASASVTPITSTTRLDGFIINASWGPTGGSAFSCGGFHS